MKQTGHGEKPKLETQSIKDIVAWLLNRILHKTRAQPRLTVLERIALAPRHSLSLIEADGCKLLVATSQDGASAFYSFDRTASPLASSRRTTVSKSAVRVSC